MIEFKKILFPVDLSESSAVLAEFALALALKFSSELHLLFVVRTIGYPPGVDYVPPPSLISAQEELAERMRANLQEFAEAHLAAAPSLKLALASGHVAREILTYIEENDISLVVMGTQGRKGLDRVVFGSVAQRVVQSSPVPVMTVNPFK